MKSRIIRLLFCLPILFTGCNTGTDYNDAMKNIRKEFDDGNLWRTIYLADSVKRIYPENSELAERADSISQIAERIAIDFQVSEEQVIKKLEKTIGQFSKEEMKEWESKGWLEERVIDGRKMYFKRAASNLLLLKKFYEKKDLWIKENAEDPEMIFRLNHTKEACRLSDNQSDPVLPVNTNITYTITVHPDVAPEGEIIRCWMPWPKSNHPRQKNVELLSTSCTDYMISPDTAIHSTIYMEQKVKKGIPTIFTVAFHYQSSAQCFKIHSIRTLPYKRSSAYYKKYTSEQLPQINFSDKVKRVADSIAGAEENPVEVVRKIYLWFKESIPWTGALEYSIMADIPEYVLSNRRGDCGMQTFLLISMLRYKGIPVRWQSGWMIPPDSENLHDWCEVYYEGTGWVPVDVSYDLQNSASQDVKEFYLSGIDSYRLIVNDGIAGNLYPKKQFMRSEPYDFQRGEVEWKQGNLYFDKWDYNIKIDYLK